MLFWGMGHRDTCVSCVYGVNRALVGAYENATTQATNIQVQRVSGGTQDGDVIIDIQAIGRWK